MIEYIDSGDLFESRADALVNPVNCDGTMGKGIALEFKKRFPECMTVYKSACGAGELLPGTLLCVHLVVQPETLATRRPAIILFATKNHWRGKSRVEWVETGLRYLGSHYHEWGIKSVAMPQLGCGLGGLEWAEVKLLVEKYLAHEYLRVEVYFGTAHDYGEKPAFARGSHHA